MSKRKAAIDWKALADLICQVLETVRDNYALFQSEARSHGITLEQLTAAALIQVIEETLEADATNHTD
jgi:hypothetical protein